MDKVKKVRSSNLELYRIILMFLIVAHHYVIGSGLFVQFDYTNVTGNMIFLQIFSMFGSKVLLYTFLCNLLSNGNSCIFYY